MPAGCSQGAGDGVVDPRAGAQTTTRTEDAREGVGGMGRHGPRRKLGRGGGVPISYGVSTGRPHAGSGDGKGGRTLCSPRTAGPPPPPRPLGRSPWQRRR